MKKNKIIAVMGPSGAGKDSIVREVAKRNPSLHQLKMYTTRPRRDKNDTVYEFVTRDIFENMLSLGLIIYYEVYNDWYYGYALDQTKEVQIGVFTPSAVRHFAAVPQIELITFLLDVPEEERVKRSLRREDRADVNEIERRLAADRKDFANTPPATVLPNVTREDFNKAVQIILSKTQN